MANVLVVLLVLVMAWYIRSVLRRRGHGIIARRGLSIGADLGVLADTPRVRVREVATVAPGRVRLALRPESHPDDRPDLEPPPELQLEVSLRMDEFGFEVLRQWQRDATSVAIVLPPGSRIVRLRSVDDLQPLTLRRTDEP